MHQLIEREVVCPYCAERLDALIDPSEVGSTYIEDCQLCCAPITFAIREDQGIIQVEVYSQDDIV